MSPRSGGWLPLSKCSALATTRRSRLQVFHGLIPQVGEDAGRLLGRLVLLPSLFRLRCDHPEQPRVLGQTEEVVRVVGLAPGS